MIKLIVKDEAGNLIASSEQERLEIEGDGKEFRILLKNLSMIKKSKKSPVESLHFMSKKNKEIVAKSLYKLLMDKDVDLVQLEISNDMRSIPSQDSHWMKTEYTGESFFNLRILNRKCQRKKRK